MRSRNAFSRGDRPAASSGSSRGMRPGCRFVLTLALALMMSPGFVTACRAEGLVIQVLNSIAPPGSTGSFDVVLINDNPGASYNVAANSLDISITGPAGVTITDVNMNTTEPYIFLGQSIDQNNGLPLGTINTPPTGFTSNDAGDPTTGLGYQTVNPSGSPGDTFGLAHVVYTVSPTAAFGSLFTININSIDIGTSLTDNNDALLSFTPFTGTITAIPEPSALIQGVIAAMIGLGSLGWRRRRPSASRCVRAEAAGR